jgi:hypothetical protein
MKFAVGIMLTSFGIFWGAEGAGADWPGRDAALLVLVPVVAVVSLIFTALLRRGGPSQPTAPAPAAAASAPVSASATSGAPAPAPGQAEEAAGLVQAPASEQEMS